MSAWYWPISCSSPNLSGRQTNITILADKVGVRKEIYTCTSRLQDRYPYRVIQLVRYYAFVIVTIVYNFKDVCWRLKEDSIEALWSSKHSPSQILAVYKFRNNRKKINDPPQHERVKPCTDQLLCSPRRLGNSFSDVKSIHFQQGCPRCAHFYTKPQKVIFYFKKISVYW